MTKPVLLLILCVGLVLLVLAGLYLVEPIRLAVTMAQYQVKVDMNTVTIEGEAYYSYMTRAVVLLVVGIMATTLSGLGLYKARRR